MLTDPIADMLSRIRNANRAMHDTVSMPTSRMKEEIARLLHDEGYIKGFSVVEAEPVSNLVIELKFGKNRERVITDLKRVSKPGRRVYAKKDRLPRVLGGLGTAILSTSTGVITTRQAAERGVGERSSHSSGSAMSRIGRKPIELPSGVTVEVSPGGAVKVTGPLGTLEQRVPARMQISQEDGVVNVARPTDRGDDRALHGLTRTLVANMVEGVTKGFEKHLEIQGVGYRAQLKGSDLELQVGFSHTVTVTPREGISFDVPAPTQVTVKGTDKQVVGQTAAEIRKVRPPEPYKGKGIRYQGEHVRRKVGKRA